VVIIKEQNLDKWKWETTRWHHVHVLFEIKVQVFKDKIEFLLTVYNI